MRATLSYLAPTRGQLGALIRALSIITLVALIVGCSSGSQYTSLQLDLQRVRDENSKLKNTNRAISEELSKAMKESAEYRERLGRLTDRQTILYDRTTTPVRKWLIPAEVRPIIVGDAIQQAEYSYYDHKTRFESAKQKPSIIRSIEEH